MANPQQTSAAVELIKFLLPVATFFLGYLLSVFDKFRDEQKSRKNLRMILGKELIKNYALLNRITPQNEEFPPPQLIVGFAQSLHFQVFDAYLHRLNTLKSSIVESVYDAYSALQHLERQAKDYSMSSSGRQANQTHLTALATALVMAANSAYEKCIEALQKLPDGPESISRLYKEKGSALENWEEILNFLDKKKEK